MARSGTLLTYRGLVPTGHTSWCRRPRRPKCHAARTSRPNQIGSAPTVFRLNQGVQVLGDLIGQQPARAVIQVPDPGPGERPRPSTRWEGIAEQHCAAKAAQTGCTAIALAVSSVLRCDCSAMTRCADHNRCAAACFVSLDSVAPLPHSL